MKKKIYYFTFTVLGVILGFFLHMIAEIVYINLLLEDFPKYGFGWSWTTWENIHSYGVMALVLAFGWLGLKSAKHWWRILYVEKKYSKKWGVKLKENF